MAKGRFRAQTEWLLKHEGSIRRTTREPALHTQWKQTRKSTNNEGELGCYKQRQLVYIHTYTYLLFQRTKNKAKYKKTVLHYSKISSVSKQTLNTAVTPYLHPTWYLSTYPLPLKNRKTASNLGGERAALTSSSPTQTCLLLVNNRQTQLEMLRQKHRPPLKSYFSSSSFSMLQQQTQAEKHQIGSDRSDRLPPSVEVVTRTLATLPWGHEKNTTKSCDSTTNPPVCTCALPSLE